VGGENRDKDSQAGIAREKESYRSFAIEHQKEFISWAQKMTLRGQVTNHSSYS
jgi:hypothetical protein